jgi:hypothetical protein
MNGKPHIGKYSGGRIVWAIAGLMLAGCSAASAQQTNMPARPDYSFFRIIVDRNIFNPDRYPRQSRSSRRDTREGPAVDAFSLVGTMSYQKGTFAFFDGTSSDYRKVLKLDDAIAGYKVTEITPNAVTLKTTDKQIEMKVGSQMRHEDQGGWQLVSQSELPSETAENSAAADTSSSSATENSSGDEGNDVLKKLMQQREQELK